MKIPFYSMLQFIMTFYNTWMKMSCYNTWNSVCCLLFIHSSLKSHPRHLREYAVSLLKLHRYKPDLRSTLFCSYPAFPRQNPWPDPTLMQPLHFHYYRNPLLLHHLVSSCCPCFCQLYREGFSCWFHIKPL